MGYGSELEEMLVQLRKVELCFSELESCPKAILSAARPVKKYYYTKMFQLATIVSLGLTLKRICFRDNELFFTKIYR